MKSQVMAEFEAFLTFNLGVGRAFHIFTRSPAAFCGRVPRRAVQPSMFNWAAVAIGRFTISFWKHLSARDLMEQKGSMQTTTHPITA